VKIRQRTGKAYLLERTQPYQKQETPRPTNLYKTDILVVLFLVGVCFFFFLGSGRGRAVGGGGARGNSVAKQYRASVDPKGTWWARPVERGLQGWGVGIERGAQYRGGDRLGNGGFQKMKANFIVESRGG